MHEESQSCLQTSRVAKATRLPSLADINFTLICDKGSEFGKSIVVKDQRV